MEEIISFCREWLKFYPHQYQREFLEKANHSKRTVAIWCRQTGKSTSVAALSVYKAISNSDYTILIVAPTENQSKELFNKIRAFMQSNQLIRDAMVMDSMTEILLNNNSRIKALPSGPEGVTIRGYTANLLILEESGFLKDSVVNEVCMPMVAATNGDVIQIGTPKMKNHFYEAAHGEGSQYDYFKVRWERAVEEGQLTNEFVEEQKETLLPIEFKTEYEADFVEQSDIYFPRDLINSCIDEMTDKKRSEGYEDGYLIGNDIFYMGVDFARLGEDSTVIVIMNWKGYVRHIEEFQSMKLTEVMGHIHRLKEKFRVRKIFLDESGLGAGPSDMLREQLGGIVFPYTFTMKTKQDIYSHLTALMERGIIKIPKHKKLLAQLYDLRYEFTGTNKYYREGDMKIHHSERGHDDYCDALALVAQGIPLQSDYYFGMA